MMVDRLPRAWQDIVDAKGGVVKKEKRNGHRHYQASITEFHPRAQVHWDRMLHRWQTEGTIGRPTLNDVTQTL